MPDERTRRFERLLTMRRQLERLAQWRLAAARRERILADEQSVAAEQNVDRRMSERCSLLEEATEPASMRTSLIAEKRAEHELREARSLAASRLKVERQVQQTFLAAQRQTKQTERLTDAAHRALDEAEQRLMQIEWDEHGRRKDRKGLAIPSTQTAPQMDAGEEREVLP
jgi:hypothetical protein